MTSPQPPTSPQQPTSPQPPIQLQLTEEQQALIHKVTGEHASILELMPDPSDGSSGEGHGLHFGWRLSADSGIPRQQWVLGRRAPPPAPDEGASA
jgi:hypothetical protein